jgi:hypothetical protein
MYRLLVLLVFCLPLRNLYSMQGRTFAEKPEILLGLKLDRSPSMCFADVDNDGDMDVLVANGRHWPQANEVFLNNGSGRFTVGYQMGSEFATSYGVPAGDLDGDGDMDVIVANDRAPNMIYVNDGTGRYSFAGAIGPEVEPTRGVILADLNRDGLPDALVTNRGAENGIYLNQGNLKFSKKRGFGTSDDSTISLAVADVNSDGYPDLILANRDGQGNAIYNSLVVIDLDRDGDNDIVVGNVRMQNAVYFNDGTGRGFTEFRFGGEKDITYGVAAADINGDGFPEIGVANSDGLNGIHLNRPAKKK